MVCYFCGKDGHTCPNCFKLQAAKRANNPKVHVSQTQDHMVLINELLNNVKTENILLFDKVKNLELELFVTREQTSKTVVPNLNTC